MKWFQGTYDPRYNTRHRISGHLFQGRYKAIPVETKEAGYFAAVSEYIHLNPVRAGLVREPKGELAQYRWSSYPLFAQNAKLPDWLRRDLVFSALELPDEGVGSRRRYRAWMAARVRDVSSAEPTVEEADRWKQLRRGWYLGSDTFRDQLMDWAAGLARTRHRPAYAGSEPLRRHDEKEAEQLLQTGLCRLGLAMEEARQLRKSDPRKQAVAWWVKSQSVVGDRWIARQLEMGHRSNVSRAVSAFRTTAGRTHRKLKKLLHICTD